MNCGTPSLSTSPSIHAPPRAGVHAFPTDRAKAGCKRHLVTDAYGIPLVVTVGPANQRDEQAVPLLLWLLGAVLACIRGGRPRPGAFQGDRGYGFVWTIALVLAWGIRS